MKETSATIKAKIKQLEKDWAQAILNETGIEAEITATLTTVYISADSYDNCGTVAEHVAHTFFLHFDGRIEEIEDAGFTACLTR